MSNSKNHGTSARPSNRHFKNGAWVTEDELVISPLDLAVLRGFGVFDFMTATDGVIFHLNSHLRRYEASARAMGLELELTSYELGEIIREGVERNRDHADLFIRLILTGGISDDFITPGVPTFMVLFHPAQRPKPELYRQGAKVISYNYQRSMAEVKSLSYGTAVMALREARAVGAAEAIYIDSISSQVYEGTGSNVFGVSHGVLITPCEGILLGVMREIVLELANELGIGVVVRPIGYDELISADEVFITSSVKRILPVREIDDNVISSAVGPVTARLMKALVSHLHH